MPTLKRNKNATFNYSILDEIEAGLVLSGAEVKSIKAGKISLKGSYIAFDNKNEAWLYNCYINPYEPAGDKNSNDPNAQRKLLLKKSEIAKLLVKSKEGGLTIIPISVYTKGTLLKLKIAIARGKSKKDKREVIKDRETKRSLHRLMRGKG